VVGIGLRQINALLAPLGTSVFVDIGVMHQT
jgi:hypothetical protein